MSKVDVRISIPDRNFDSTVNAAREAGFAVTAKFDLLGVVLGSIEDTSLAKLRRVPGIGSVEPQQEYSIPAPVDESR